MKKIALLLCLLLLTQLLAGCYFSPPIAIFHGSSTSGLDQNALDALLEEAKLPYDAYFAGADAALQLEQVMSAAEGRYRIFAVELAEPGNTQAAEAILQAAGDIPVVFFGNSLGYEGNDIALLDSYPSAGFIGPDPLEGGIIQGRMIGSYVLNNYGSMDLNGDGVITYALFRGEEENTESTILAQRSVEEADVILTDAGRIALSYYDSQNHDRYQIAGTSAQTARQLMSDALAYWNTGSGNMIELVICTDDALVLGAVEALQDAGFNLPHTCTIPVFGFGNAPDVQNLLSTGAVSGTVRTDNTAITDALFTVLQTVCGKHTIAHAIAALSSDSRFYVTEDCLSRLCLTCYPVD